MALDQGITHELGFGEVLSKTFELYRRNFAKYFVLYLVVEAIIGLVSTLAYRTFSLPTLPINPTRDQIVNWAPGFFGNLILLVTAVGVVSIVFGTLAVGGTVRMASDEVENRPVGLGSSLRFAASKLIWMWALGILLAIIIGLGFIALIVPGIILAIMFCLAFPALLIEDAGVIGSLGRSRELVSHRWLKTFVVLLILVIIVAIAAAIVSAISAPFDGANNFVSSVLSAFYQPIIPISLTVYLYSNRARISSAQTSQSSMGPAMMAPPGMKFCPNCGTQLETSVTFCSKCGAKQPV